MVRRINILLFLSSGTFPASAAGTSQKTSWCYSDVRGFPVWDSQLDLQACEKIPKRKRQQFSHTHTHTFTAFILSKMRSHLKVLVSSFNQYSLLSIYVYKSVIYNAKKTSLVLLLKISAGGQTEPFLIDRSSANLKKLSLQGNACNHHAKIPLWFRISLLTSHSVEMQTTDRLFPPSISKLLIPSLRQRAERSRLWRAWKGQTAPSMSLA